MTVRPTGKHQDIQDTNTIRPDILFVENRRRPSLEIKIDYLTDYWDLRWFEAVLLFTAQFVQSSQFNGNASLWNYCSVNVESINLGKAPARPMWNVDFGMPESFMSALEVQMRALLGDSNVRFGEAVNPSREDGWQAVCHVAGGQVYRALDAYEWAIVDRSKKL